MRANYGVGGGGGKRRGEGSAVGIRVFTPLRQIASLEERPNNTPLYETLIRHQTRRPAVASGISASI